MSEPLPPTAVVEAILFLEGVPTTVRRLARISGLSPELVTECLGTIRDRLGRPEHGIQLTRAGDTYSIVPKASLWDGLREHYADGTDARLSRAALETLTIVAYSQPVTRSQIEAMRGVSADGMIKLLSERQMIHAVGRKEGVAGRPVLFGTTQRFLQTFGLETIDDLPRLDDVEESRFQRLEA